MTLPFTAGRQWPDEHFEELRRQHIAGLSASQIAKALNAKFLSTYSRCAVIGQIHRNLADTDRVRAPSAPKRTVTVTPRDQARAFGPTKVPPTIKIAGNGALYEPAEAMAPRYAARADAFAPLPGAHPKPWIERGFGECCWPVSDDGALSCCEPVFSGSWCVAHDARGHLRTSSTGDLLRSVRRVA